MENESETQIAEKERKSYFRKFSAMSFTYWLATVFTSYMNIFLQSIGWSTVQVGVMNSINSAVGVVSTPLWGAVSDKMRSIKRVMILLIITSAISYGLIPYVDFSIIGIPVLFIIIPISFFFRSPIYHLVDNWTVRACNKHNLNFGVIRSYGSFIFGAVGMFLGYLVTKINEDSNTGMRGTIMTFWMYSLMLLTLLVVVLTIKDDSGGNEKRLKLKDMQIGQLFHNYHYTTYLFYAMVARIPVACVNSFLPYLISDVNVNSSMFGYIAGYKAFVEIPMLLLFKKGRKKVPLYWFLIGSGVFYMLMLAFYSRAQSFAQIFMISTCEGIGGGLFIAANPNYIYELAPNHLKATAQTVCGAMISITAMIVNLVGGILIARIGIRQFFLLIAGVLLCAILLYMFSLYFGEKVLKIKKPNTLGW